ncbi:hypothetical protein N7462_011566 [Penicillium macrosclerotiorum]|uniref:uncharacterized protein n=1 Tax=Penicillium macrosclerotiorum TaxID=303699 RepID=UPI0025480EFF|nr:uncharacterized protein N7462_011566 [Penicillium macrosclerotiorum]KAJ5664753.1 hypothetical protein N7462_011566 [Penicillium macrosclerotiorum]
MLATGGMVKVGGGSKARHPNDLPFDEAGHSESRGDNKVMTSVTLACQQMQPGRRRVRTMLDRHYTRSLSWRSRKSRKERRGDTHNVATQLTRYLRSLGSTDVLYYFFGPPPELNQRL